MKILMGCSSAMIGLLFSASVWAQCVFTDESSLHLQILGSGGPGASSGRASSAYVIWVDGVGRILVDAGSGSKVPFHQSGANFEDIDLVALSHLHPDHAAELPALLWTTGGSFRISGPSGAGFFPPLERFLELLFGQGGAFNVLANRMTLDLFELDVTTGDAVEVWRDGDIVVQGKRVPHGDVPALGYRVDFGDKSIAISGDQNGSDPTFIEFIKDVDVLVVHFGGTEASGGLNALHAKPSVWGQMATDANAGHVVVSHISTSSPQVLEESLGLLRSNYTGLVTVAEDLLCVEVN